MTNAATLSDKPIAILGAGAWGTALALHTARLKKPVRLWSMREEEITRLLKDQENKQFLQGFPLLPAITPTSDLKSALDGVQDIIVAMPSVAFRDTLLALKPLLPENACIISATKGIEEHTNALWHQVCQEILGSEVPYAALSGPTFAKEVAANLPTCVMLACKDAHLAARLQRMMQAPTFHIVLSDDIEGVEIGAIVKNVVAIVVGIADGLKLGSNAKSALITKGLKEMVMLGTRMGGRVDTLMGLAGAGDLILTSSDNQSRNRRFGMLLGEGHTVESALETIGQVVEGHRNLPQLLALAESQNIYLSIAAILHAVLKQELAARNAIDSLLMSNW